MSVPSVSRHVGKRARSVALYCPIAEHGLIGDLHTVSLVGTDGKSAAGLGMITDADG